MIYSTKSELVIVMGMHRSGTSLVAHCLGTLYGEIGEELIPARPDNPAGFFEDREFYALNERILRKANASWQDIGKLINYSFNEHHWHNLKQEGIRLIKDRISKHKVFIVKDPRFCVLLPFYKELLKSLDQPVKAVLVLRNPANVAKSLNKRNLISIEHGMQLWTAYNYLALREFSKNDIPWPSIISYEDLLRDPIHQIKKLLKKLGTTVPLEKIKKFSKSHIRFDLQHHNENSLEIFDYKQTPSWIKKLYVFLNENDKIQNKNLQNNIDEIVNDTDLRWYFSVIEQRENILIAAYEIYNKAKYEENCFINYRKTLINSILDTIHIAETEQEVVFYGAGTLFQIFAKMLRRPLSCVVDSNQKQQDSSIIEGHIVHPIIALMNHPNALVIITPIGAKETINATLDAIGTKKRLFFEDILAEHSKK